MSPSYRETFAQGTGGWLQIIGNGENGVRPLEQGEDSVISRSPWWVDYNHAPPGTGYLHLPFCLHTRIPADYPNQYRQAGGENGFVRSGCTTDIRWASLTLRLRGELDSKGARLLFLAQARPGEKCVGHLLTGRPFEVTPGWTQQSVVLDPDPRLWTCLGSRCDRTDFYASASVDEVLRDVNVDILLVLFPLDVAPAEAVAFDPHSRRAGEEYAVDRSRLPGGWIELDEVRLDPAS